jgi:hypothetical protein
LIIFSGEAHEGAGDVSWFMGRSVLGRIAQISIDSKRLKGSFLGESAQKAALQLPIDHGMSRKTPLKNTSISRKSLKPRNIKILNVRELSLQDRP